MATKSRTLGKALAIGETMATKALRRRRAAARTRKAALAKSARTVTHGVATGPKAMLAKSIAGLNESILTGVIDERIRDAYVTILSAITAICVDLIGHPVPVVIHGYDYAVPDGRGFLGGWGPLPGPWLEPGFRRKGFAAMSARQPIVIALIDRFNAMLAGLAGKPPFGHVRYLDLRHTLSIGPNYKTWWANELHPTAKGFAAVTKKFADAL